MFLALRELSFAKGRFALMGSVIALVAVLTVLLSGLATGLVDDGISGLRALPVTHLAFQSGADSTFSRSTVDGDSVAALSAVPGATAEPFGLTLVNATSNHDLNVDLALMGLAEDGFIAAEMFPDGPTRESGGHQPGTDRPGRERRRHPCHRSQHGHPQRCRGRPDGDLRPRRHRVRHLAGLA